MIPQPARPRRSSDRAATIIQSEADWNRFWGQIEADAESIDLEPTLTAELGVLEKLHEDYFFDAADPGGNSWPPLAPSTVAAKGHSTILIDSGRLLASLTQPGPDAVRQVHGGQGSFELVFGTAVPYSVFHDEASGNRPARRHVGWSDEALDEITYHVLDGAIEEMSDGKRS